MSQTKGDVLIESFEIITDYIIISLICLRPIFPVELFSQLFKPARVGSFIQSSIPRSC